MHLLEGPDLGHSMILLWWKVRENEDRRSKKAEQDSTPQSHDQKASALPLRYKRSPFVLILSTYPMFSH